jgi:hypothetical protein
MPETVNLAAPITKPATTAIQLQSLNIDLIAGSVYVVWKGDNNEIFSASYPTPSPNAQPSGMALITALNTANLSTVSLVKRIYNRLITDGYIAGTVAGTPQ